GDRAHQAGGTGADHDRVVAGRGRLRCRVLPLHAWPLTRARRSRPRKRSRRDQPAVPWTAVAGYGSALATQQAAADPEHVAQAELAVAVLVEHGTEQAAADAALPAHLLLLLAQDRTEQLGARIGAAAGAAVLEHPLGQEGEHDRGEDLHQLAGLVVAQAGGLAEPGLGARQLAAEHVAEDARAVGLPRLLATEHGPEQAAEIARAGEVGLQ